MVLVLGFWFGVLVWVLGFGVLGFVGELFCLQFVCLSVCVSLSVRLSLSGALCLDVWFSLIKDTADQSMVKEFRPPLVAPCAVKDGLISLIIDCPVVTVINGEIIHQDRSFFKTDFLKTKHH